MIPEMSLCYRGFYETWCILDEKNDVNTVNDYTIPWVVNGAFACEIGMKYILQRNNIKYDKIHLLHELFNLLPDNHKIEIMKELCEKNPLFSPKQLNQEILLISNAVCEFRYSFEEILVLKNDFFRSWCVAIFKQVNKYPSYEITERDWKEDDISLAEFDQKVLKAQNEMLSRLKRKKTNNQRR